MSSFTKVNLGDVHDVAPEHGYGEIMEARFANADLGLERVGMSHQRVEPGKRLPFGHTHSVQEEVYVVLAGSGELKVDDEVVALGGRLDAVRVAAGAWRGLQAGPDGLEFLAFGGPVTEERDADMEPGWWPEEG